jgi:hypothetical protein
LIIAFSKTDEGVQKFGMFPCKADLDFGALDPVFSKELAPVHRRELGSAIGLRAHGVGVGSFVYLRRIFESLLEEAHEKARAGPDWDEVVFERSRTAERIGLLRAFLPPRLVSSAPLYGFLSQGIHELQEGECLEHFDLVFQAIEMVLRQKHDVRVYSDVLAKLNKASTPPA